VNNAAYTSGRAWGAPLAELTRASWLEQFATNLHSAFTLIQQVAPHMEAEGGGVVVNITSGAADMAPLETGGGRASAVMGSAPLAYGSSKAALNRLANALAPQLAQANIAIVNVEPGFVRTEMVDVMAERGFDASAAVPMSDPATAVVKIITDDDPMRWSGQVVYARDLI
jgi:NAD(P)-dependent dehydrogenase (short-subunit alcohol dehydrogenase family)